MSFSLTRKTKTCFAEGCESLIPVSVLMCRAHWALVPQAQKQEILHTLSGWQRGETPRPYLDAIKRARIAVKGVEERAAATLESLENDPLKLPASRFDVLGTVGDGGRVTFRPNGRRI